jgi:hypothetical protein
MVGFDLRHEIVIRDALHRWDEVHPSESRAAYIDDALALALNEKWNIIVYDSYAEEAGYDTWLHYENKWWVCGHRNTGDCYRDSEAIKEFMDTEFGCFVLGDCSKVQSSAQAKINHKFPGCWRVQVVKFQPESARSCSTWGPGWEHSGYHFYIMRTSS